MPAETPEDATPQPGPYALTYDAYYSAGWRSILPLPPRKKGSPPSGYTGNEGIVPSFGDLMAWAEERADGNIALRMPRNVIGIDVDAYEGKKGAATFAELIGKYGVLPNTWRSTSRDDGVSAIRFFAIPEGLAWPSILGAGIEVVRFAHRYAVVWPSVHPDTGGTYRWIDPDGRPVIGVVPRVEALPMLPDAWVAGLTGGEAERLHARANLTDEATRAWVAERGGGRPCRAVTNLLGRYVLALADAGDSRHDTALKATRALVEMAGEGHLGVEVALGQVHSAFTRAIDEDPDRAGEWERMVTGAVRLAAANHPDQVATDPCEDPMHGLMIHTVQPPPRSDPWTTPTPTSSTSPAAPSSPPTGPDASSSSAGSEQASTTSSTSSESPSTTDEEGMATLRAQYLAQEVERERARREAKRVLDREETEAIAADNPNRFVTGASFVLDLPEATPTVWGTGDEILWAQGEACIIAGGSGVGKTTIASQVVAAMLGLGPRAVLGLDVMPVQRNVLYLAMDRPQQAARALARVFRPEHRGVLEARLKVWQGPPPADVAKAPETLLKLAVAADASVLIVDSLKDAAVGLSEDGVSAGYNRARQMCLAEGVEVLELHHMVKKGANGAKPKELSDVYGGAWLTAGAGSVILISGDPGDPVVEMRHLKQPMEEVGPYQVIHDHRLGESSIYRSTDLVQVARASGAAGVAARSAAQRLFETDKPTSAQVEKTRRKLMALAESGHLVHVPGGSRAVADVWVASQPDVATLGGLVEPRAITPPGFTSRVTQDESGVDPSVNPREADREAVTSDDAKNVNPREAEREAFTRATPPIRGGREAVKGKADSGARVVLRRGGHVVDGSTGEVVE